MSANSNIEWTDATWNPTRGCSRVSEGCRHCYAERFAARFAGPGGRYEGLVKTHPSGEPRWTGDVRLVPEQLDQPLRWKKPQRIFVNSMSDLFHEKLRDEEIAAVFGVMAAAPQHTFQVLTKRPEWMRQWFEWIGSRAARDVMHEAVKSVMGYGNPRRPGIKETRWPLHNVWLGVSVENQETADERIPMLLQTPAAVRFVSYEPALGPVDFSPWLDGQGTQCSPKWCRHPFLDWVIVGGESGPGSRPFDVAWARSVIEQCGKTGVACFVKQLGARPFGDGTVGPNTYDALGLRDRKGGDMAEWPEDLRVREMPEAKP